MAQMSQEGLRDKKEKHENSRYLGMVLETQWYRGTEILTGILCNVDILIIGSFIVNVLGTLCLTRSSVSKMPKLCDLKLYHRPCQASLHILQRTVVFLTLEHLRNYVSIVHKFSLLFNQAFLGPTEILLSFS